MASPSSAGGNNLVSLVVSRLGRWTSLAFLATFIAGMLIGLSFGRETRPAPTAYLGGASVTRARDEQPSLSRAKDDDVQLLRLKDDENEKTNNRRRPKLADGCWGVYLDVGSNIGVQVRKLFEPEKYPGAPVLSYFRRHFGSPEERRQPGRVCAIGFEANPLRMERLRGLEECYNSLGWRTHFVGPRAVLNTDNETIDFMQDRFKGQGLAASMFANKWSDENKVHKVQTIHLGKFIMDEIAGREIPPGYDAPGPVFAKIDIEGAEYQAFGGLITSGALCEIKEATVEFHESFIPEGERRDNSLLLQGMVKSLSRLSPLYTGCKTMTIGALDDESFRGDRKEVPEQCKPF